MDKQAPNGAPAGFGVSKKIPGQGTAAKVNYQAPVTSSAPSSKDVEPKQTPQTLRGFHTPGKGGTSPGPKPFKG